MTEAAITPGPTTPEPTAPEPTAPGRVVVLGAGTMGTGIALAFALAGSTVHGWSRRTVSIERAERHLDAAVGDLADLGLLREPPKAVRHRIRLGTDVRAGLTATASVRDLAGNETSATSAPVKIDRTAPTAAPGWATPISSSRPSARTSTTNRR